MKYKVNLTSSEWEIIAEDFDFDKFYEGCYDDNQRLDLTREAWLGNRPLYLHAIDTFSLDEIIKKAEGIVTSEPIFSIFGKENLTFAEMLQEIWNRRKEIVKITPGDENPYE
jgi:hypothetical protein|uniref:Uncharacterized protein n=1 Tax=candidate division WOR-3 bacterium TaxID=2052148 RepID=A0A7V3RH74_UNCW3